MRVALALGVLLALARVASAYPQFQLSKDQTCTSCHIDPAGGLLLNENGLSVAQTIATWDVAPEAAHGALVGPGWLQLGGDLRGAAGVVQNRKLSPAAFPMQADGDVLVRGHGLTFMGTFGFQQGGSPQTIVESHEHWLMWQPDPTDTTGLYLRVGRFMPVYGIRLSEHDVYTRRYGGTPLWGEAYGAAAEYIDPKWEVHVTGFVHDPLQDSAEHGNGGAAYGEARITKELSFGLEGRYAKSDEDSRLQGGVTAKYWLEAANLLLEGEAQVIKQKFPSGFSQDQIVSYLLGSWFVHAGWFVDLGVGQFDEDINVKGLGLEGVDANVHWFATSHWELLLTNRVQVTALGAGPTSGFSLLQFHYRL